jgi:hypothetical protein
VRSAAHASIQAAEIAMTRPRPAAVSHRLSLFDHYGWALRLVKKVREGKTVAAAVGLARAYARDVRDIECAGEATRFVGRSAGLIRRNCAVPTTVIRRWREAARDYGSGAAHTDRKLANFLAAMCREVSVAQIANVVREASAQVAKAKARKDAKKSSGWRKVAANLEAMRQSIAHRVGVAIPFPRT